MRDEPCRQEAATRCAHGEPCEHDGNQKRAFAGGGKLGYQRGGVGHDAAHGAACDKAEHHQLPDVAGVGNQQRGAAEAQHVAQQHFAPPEFVGERAGNHRAHRQARQRCAEHGGERVVGELPIGFDIGGDKAHDGNVKTVCHHDKKAKGDDEFLVEADGAAV